MPDFACPDTRNNGPYAFITLDGLEGEAPNGLMAQVGQYGEGVLQIFHSATPFDFRWFTTTLVEVA